MATVTCHTAGCVKENEPVAGMVLTYQDDDGETQTVDAVICGACGENITDISAE